MTIPVFPTIPQYAYPLKRSAMWKTDVQTAVSGKETRIQRWTYPKWQWAATFETLRMLASSPAELQALISLYNQVSGQAQPFLFADPDDNQVTGQVLGAGTGSLTTFQLVRAFGGVGGFVEPIYAPNTVTNVYVNGVAQTGWTVGAYGSSSPGVITMASAPLSGAAVTADFSFYFPCRFIDDQVEFSRNYAGIYSCDKLAFQSIK
jgi:uncharacterized protein (TIGR02217 family)